MKALLFGGALVAMSLLLGGCGEPVAAAATPPSDPAPFLAELGQGHAVEHFVPRLVGGRMTVLLIAATSDHRRLRLFESDPAASAPAGYSQVLGAEFALHGHGWMIAGQPDYGDLDGDGVDEILVPFSVTLADRVSTTAMLLVRGGGAWRARSHPGLLLSLRSQGRRLELHQDDRMASAVVAGRALEFHGLSHGGGWQLVARPGGGVGLLGCGARTGDVEAPGLALVMFRLAGEVFIEDQAWHHGEPHLVRLPSRDFDLQATARSLFR